MTTLIQPDADSRLAQLSAQYDLAKAERDKADETFKVIADAIKTELAAAAPGETDVRLDTDTLARPLRLQAVESWRVDSKRLKTEAPETYVRYAVKSTAWRLAEIRA